MKLIQLNFENKQQEFLTFGDTLVVAAPSSVGNDLSINKDCE